MINPYEAPQTVAKSSSRVIAQLDPDFAVLQGAKYCARGGKLLMAAAISELLGVGVLIWIQYAKQFGSTNLLNLFGWIFLSVSWLLLLVGAVMNMLGYARFMRYLDHDTLVKLFRTCRRMSWLKIVLILGAFALYDAKFLGESYPVQSVILPVLLISILYSNHVHAKGMRIWSDNYPNLSANYARRIYLWSGFAGTVLFFGLYAPLFAEEKGLVLYLFSIVMLCFVASFAAFSNFYGRLSKTLDSSEFGAEIASVHD